MHGSRPPLSVAAKRSGLGAPLSHPMRRAPHRAREVMALLDSGPLAALTVSFRQSRRAEGHPSMTEKRKLAAILAADVVGFSRLTGSDEEGTLARLRTLWSDLIAPTICITVG